MIRRTFGGRLLRVFAIEIVAGVVRLGAPLAMARAIGAGPYGAYAASTNLTALVFSLSASGVPLAAAYYCATTPGAATGRRLLGCGSLLATGGAVVAAPGVLLYQATALDDVALPMLIVATVAAIPYTAELTALGVMRGLGNNEKASLLGLLRQISLVAIAGGVAWLGGGATLAVLAFALATTALGGFASVSALLESGRQGGPAPELKSIFRYSGHVQASTLLTFLNFRLTLFLVGALAPASAMGVYAAVLSVAEGIWLFSHVVSSVLVGEVASAPDSTRARGLTARACRLVTASSFAMALVGAGSSKWIMPLFGPEFASGWDVLAVQLLAASILAPSRVLANHQAATGSPRANIAGTAAGLAVNVLLTLVLLPALGLVGAALAAAASYAVVASDRIRTFVGSSGGDDSTVGGLLVPQMEDIRALVKALPLGGSRPTGPAND